MYSCTCCTLSGQQLCNEIDRKLPLCEKRKPSSSYYYEHERNRAVDRARCTMRRIIQNIIQWFRIGKYKYIIIKTFYRNVLGLYRFLSLSLYVLEYITRHTPADFALASVWTRLGWSTGHWVRKYFSNNTKIYWWCIPVALSLARVHHGLYIYSVSGFSSRRIR